MRTKQGINDLIKGIMIEGGVNVTNLDKIANRIIELLIEENNLFIPRVVECKSYGFEKTIDLLDAEIDSLKDAYHQETIIDRKTVYSSMILETIKAKKKLME